MNNYQIGEISTRVGASADTLRYYERIGLLPKITRDSSGRRIFDDKDLSRIRFIRRAQRMSFTLNEIGQLLEMRENPQGARNEIRALMQTKLQEVEANLEELNTLRNEMRLLINLCRGTDSGCPIIEEIDQNDSD